MCNEDLHDGFLDQLKDGLQSYTGDLTDEQWEEWRDFVCEGDGAKVFVGDHLESASPADPSFWVIHPTLERLLHARYMAGFSTENWPSDAQDDYVCDKSACYEDGVKVKPIALILSLTIIY